MPYSAVASAARRRLRRGRRPAISGATAGASHERSSSSTTSSCLIESSRLLLLMPSVSIVMQNGHALAIVFAPVSSELERALHVHAVLVLLLHPHLRAAGAAAEAALLGPVLRLDELDAGDALQDLARRVVHAVVAAEVAGVVVDDAPLDGLGRHELALGQEAEQEVGVVHDFDLERRSPGTRS